MIQSVALGVVAGYGALTLLGGIIGYATAKSRASLIAGGVSGLLLMGSAALALTQPGLGLSIAAAVSAGLVYRFAKAALSKKRANGVAIAMIGGGLAVLVVSGLALI
jgi:uncharacterized membrane protein (UPF0136 family)